MPLQRPKSRGQRAKRSVATFKGLIANGLIVALHKVLKVIRGLHHCRAKGAGRCTKLASGATDVDSKRPVVSGAVATTHVNSGWRCARGGEIGVVHAGH